MIVMCEFCEPNEKDLQNFEEWAGADPYNGEYIHNEGIQYALYPNGLFVIACAFDGGYIGDETNLHFRYCPYCGKEF